MTTRPVRPMTPAEVLRLLIVDIDRERAALAEQERRKGGTDTHARSNRLTVVRDYLAQRLGGME